MSKISIPCIFPKISRRSRPVDCSRSVGIVPGAAPGPRRSFSFLTSVYTRQHWRRGFIAPMQNLVSEHQMEENFFLPSNAMSLPSGSLDFKSYLLAAPTWSNQLALYPNLFNYRGSGSFRDVLVESTYDVLKRYRKLVEQIERLGKACALPKQRLFEQQTFWMFVKLARWGRIKSKSSTLKSRENLSCEALFLLASRTKFAKS